MPARKPERYWRSYGTDPLPIGSEAMEQPFAAFRPGSYASRVTDAKRTACSPKRTLTGGPPLPGAGIVAAASRRTYISSMACQRDERVAAYVGPR